MSLYHYILVVIIVKNVFISSFESLLCHYTCCNYRKNVFFKFESAPFTILDCNYRYSEWSTVVDISISPPSFKPVSLLLSRISSILKHPNKSFFNPINIFEHLLHTLYYTIINYYFLSFSQVENISSRTTRIFNIIKFKYNQFKCNIIIIVVIVAHCAIEIV